MSVLSFQKEKYMRRVIDTLNEMSFELPSDFAVTEDKYSLMNGQGFINKENYLSKDGKVISLFEINRDPEDFFEYYTTLVENYKNITYKFELEKILSLKFGEFNFPMYVIKGFRDKLIYVVQVFINCGDCLGCLMIVTNKFNSDVKKFAQEDPLFNSLIKILRTVE